jgi:hypothetical protein
MSYRQLDPDQIIKTTATLALRVKDRFPLAGLADVAAELEAVARDSASRSADLALPIVWLRIAVAMAVIAGAAFFLTVGTVLPFDSVANVAFGSVESFEAALNTLVLGAFAFFALINLEVRLKRHKVMENLHELRSLIHVIDMHQLTKDPAAVQATFQKTQHSPERTLSVEELERYLDYCSEMIAVTGKLAALYAQAVNDEGVANAVNDIETLGGNLSRKIWQKIALIDARGQTPDSPKPTRRTAKQAIT